MTNESIILKADVNGHLINVPLALDDFLGLVMRERVELKRRADTASADAADSGDELMSLETLVRNAFGLPYEANRADIARVLRDAAEQRQTAPDPAPSTDTTPEVTW